MNKNKSESIESSFSKIVKDKDLPVVLQENGEFLIDSTINDGLLRDFPILSTVIGVIKFGKTVSDRIFIKKAFKVINEIGTVNWKERVEFIRELKTRHTDGSELILNMINNAEDNEKAVIIGRLAKLCASKKITPTEFKSMWRCLKNFDFNDLELLYHLNENENYLSGEEYFSFLNNGILCVACVTSPNISVERNHRYSEHDPEFKAVVDDPELYYVLTDSGKKIIEYKDEIFNEL